MSDGTGLLQTSARGELEGQVRQRGVSGIGDNAGDRNTSGVNAQEAGDVSGRHLVEVGIAVEGAGGANELNGDRRARGRARVHCKPKQE